jgi:hypothetical protein
MGAVRFGARPPFLFWPINQGVVRMFESTAEIEVTGEATFGFFVTERMAVSAPGPSSFVLERADLLVEDVAGTFVSLTAGPVASGLILSEEQQASLKPVAFVERGLDYEFLDAELLGAP